LIIYAQRQLFVEEFLISLYNIFVQDINLQEVVEAIHYRKSKTNKEIVVISGSGGSIKTYLLFFIINLCKIF
jgi:hypothetical protein